jgi:hypothetical protein
LLFDISFVANHSIYQGAPTVPASTIIDLSCSEQEQLLFEQCLARYGYWLAIHIILLCAAQAHAFGLRLVSHTMELRHPDRAT